jgi:drug/metabolite transporter (DMT)-like permease
VSVERQTKAYVLGLAAVALWSTVASAFKLALRHVGPPELLLWATLVSTIALGATLALQGRLGAAPALRRRSGAQPGPGDRLSALRPTSPAALLRSAAVAALNPFLYYLILFKAYSLLPGQEAQPLNFIWGIVLPLLSIPLLRQRIRWPSLLALVISFAGVYVIATRGQIGSLRFSNLLGVSLAVGSSILWALYWILNVRDPRDEGVKLFYNFAFGFAFTLIYVAATGRLRLPPAPALLGGAYVGLFEMGITFLLWLKALKHSRTTAQVANLIFLAPFVSLVLLHVVAGEAIYPSSVIGLVLIIAGNLLQRRAG